MTNYIECTDYKMAEDLGLNCEECQYYKGVFQSVIQELPVSESYGLSLLHIQIPESHLGPVYTCVVIIHTFS